MDTKTIIHEIEEKMKKALDVLSQHLAGIRSGRANPAMLDEVKADYYGTATPLKAMANITIPDPKQLLITPWDAAQVKAIEKAILDSNIGITPMVDGKTIRLVVPTLTRERREELAKISHKFAEEARVSCRSIRREGNERVKVLEKDKSISEDDSFKTQEDVQKLTDKHIQLIDQAQAQKDKELTQV